MRKLHVTHPMGVSEPLETALCEYRSLTQMSRVKGTAPKIKLSAEYIMTPIIRKMMFLQMHLKRCRYKTFCVCVRSWPHPRRVGGIYCRWCTRSQSVGPIRSRATHAWAASAPRWTLPTANCVMPRTRCSFLRDPSTATGVTAYFSKTILYIFCTD